MRTEPLFERYYFSQPGYTGGTALFHELCRAQCGSHGRILEIGAGPANATTAFLATLGTVTGLDVSSEVVENPAVSEAHVYDGGVMPFADGSFDVAVSNYVLEHVARPRLHFCEVFRVLKPGGAYCFRTPNRWHYVTLASTLLPHALHVRLANQLRGLGGDAHEPWRTVYGANTNTRLRQLAAESRFAVEELRMVETEPSYGAAHPALFYPMMVYERLVNCSKRLAPFRVNIFAVFRKPM